MRTIKILAILFFAVICIRGFGQKTVQNDLVCTLTNYDYSALNPVIGIVSGTIEMHFTYKLSEEGYIRSMHWNVNKVNLTNSEGERIQCVDAGHDNLGILWVFYNTPNASNDAIQPGISYNVEDGWLDAYMPGPDQMPLEGVYVENCFMLKCKGELLKLPYHIMFHMNANGVYTVEMIRP